MVATVTFARFGHEKVSTGIKTGRGILDVHSEQNTLDYEDVGNRSVEGSWKIHYRNDLGLLLAGLAFPLGQQGSEETAMQQHRKDLR